MFCFRCNKLINFYQEINHFGLNKCDCGLISSFVNDTIYRLRILIDCYEIIWSLYKNKYYCSLFKYKSNTDPMSLFIQLSKPLPFSITKEQLNKYIILL